MKLTRKQRQAAHLAWIYAAAALVTVVSVFTFYNAIITSLQTGQDLFLPSYLPTSFHWENYATALVQNGVGRSLANSVLVATVTVGGCLLVSITGEALDFLANDASTKSILVYMEGIRNARRFMSALRAAAYAKPVVVMKAGRKPAAKA